MPELTADNLLGAIILCPHCNQKLRVINVGEPVDGTNPGGQKDQYFPIQLADGYWARMWKTEW
jgi:hypothetical protein